MQLPFRMLLFVNGYHFPHFYTIHWYRIRTKFLPLSPLQNGTLCWKRKGTIMPKIERIRVILSGIFLDGLKRNNFLLQKIAILCHSLKKRLSKELWKNALQALFANLLQSANTWTFVSRAGLSKPEIFISKLEFS